jgi:hypothetical protein
VLVGGVVAAAVLIGNTGHSEETPIDTSKPAWVYHPPRAMKMSAADREQLMSISVLFVHTAVARKRLDDAWKLAGPELRQGQSRSEWDRGNIAVPPFKAAGIGAWDVLYSYTNDVAFDLDLIGAKGQPWLSKTFTIELKKHGTHWLVASWTPRGVATENALTPAARPPSIPPVKAPLSKWFLVAPAGIFAVMLLGFAAFGVLHVLRGRRAARRYADVLGHTSSSRPS